MDADESEEKMESPKVFAKPLTLRLSTRGDLDRPLRREMMERIIAISTSVLSMAKEG